MLSIAVYTINEAIKKHYLVQLLANKRALILHSVIFCTWAVLNVIDLVLSYVLWATLQN